MDVSRVLELVRPFFESLSEPYALVGGLALLAYGAPRATFDVDLLKAQAFAKDHSRYSDLADLQFLLALPGLDAQEARGYFEAAGLTEYFDRLRGR